MLEHLLALWPEAPIGINSAGIGQREWDAPIIFAGVQSVWRNAATAWTAAPGADR